MQILDKPRKHRKGCGVETVTAWDEPDIIRYADRPLTLKSHGITFDLMIHDRGIHYQAIVDSVAYLVSKPHGATWWVVFALDQEGSREHLNLYPSQSLYQSPVKQSRRREPIEVDAPEWCDRLGLWLANGGRAFTETYSTVA